MRTRTLFAAGVLAAAALFAPPSAIAQESTGEEAELPTEIEEKIEAVKDESDLGAEELHCLGEQLEALDHGERIETCEESPSPLAPAPNEIVWGVIAFAVVFLLLWRFALPAIQKGLQAREDRIRADLEGAESAKAEADAVLEEYRAQLADARNEAARIIEEARQAADAMRREVQGSAEAEAAAARERARSEIDQTVSRARGDLQREMGDFAVRLAERIVERSLDRSAQQALIDQYIAEVGALRGNGNTGG